MTQQGDVLVTGATGFVGSRLAAELVRMGRTVRAMTRHPEGYNGPGEAVAGDVTDQSSLREPLEGVQAAYYLVHSLDSDDFEQRDAKAARAFGAAAAAAGVEQVIYLGGLGDDNAALSAHLRSRREVERRLQAGGAPITALRAGVIVGHGGISWEITRQLADRLPAMITPKWVTTRTQPIAIDDVVRYLVGVLGQQAALGKTFDIGGPEVLRYVDMLHRVAKLQNHRPLPVLTVPLLTPQLSSLWLAFVTDVNLKTARNLVDSMINEVVVRETGIADIVPGEPIGFDEAVRRALAERKEASSSDGSAEA